MKQFNFSDKRIQFIIDRFKDRIVHFLDIKINGFEAVIKTKDSFVNSPVKHLESLVDECITISRYKNLFLQQTP